MIPLALAWAGAKKAVSLVPRQVWYVLAVVVAIWFYGHLRYNAGQADTQGKFDAYKKTIQEAAQRQAASNLAKEAADRAAFEQIAERHAKEIEDAKVKADRVAADLRSGIAKLQKHWRVCAKPEAAGSPQGIDEEARLREESAGRIIGNAAEADSWIERLQEVIRQLQKPPSDKGEIH